MRKIRKKDRTAAVAKRRNLGKLVLGVGLVAVAAVAAVLISVFVFFKVSDIRVEGNKVCGTEEIIAASGVNPGENLIMQNSEDIKAKILAAFPYIEDVQVRKEIPVTMKLVVKEAKKSYSVPYKGMYAYVSKDGKLLELGKKPAKGTIILRAGKIKDENGWVNFDDKHQAEVFKKLGREIDKDSLSKLTLMDIRDVHNIYVVYDNRIKLNFGNISDIGYKMNFGMQILEGKNIGAKEVGTLDLSLSRDENKAYFQPAGKIEDIVDGLSEDKEKDKDKDKDKKKPGKNDKKPHKSDKANEDTVSGEEGTDSTAEDAGTGEDKGDEAGAAEGTGEETSDGNGGGDAAVDNDGYVNNRGDDIPDIIA